MRVRTILIPAAVLAGLVGAWSAVWTWGANRSEDAIQRWLAAEAANGRVIACDERSRGGYPFRLEITCRRPTVELRDEARPYQTYRLEGLKLVSQIWSPGHVISEWTGPMTVATEGDPGIVTATWRLAQASARLNIGGYDSSNVVIDALEVVRDGVSLLKAERAEFHTRPNPEDRLSVDLVANLKGATSAIRPMAPVDAEVQLVARKLLRAAGRPQPLPLRQWHAAGGSVDVVLFRLAQGPALGLATGKLRLTVDGRPEGEIELKVANVEAALQASGLGATLGPVAAGVLTMASRPVEVEGRQGRLLTLRAAGGRLQAGPLGLGLPSLLP